MSAAWVIRVPKGAASEAALTDGLAPVDVGVRQDVSGHAEIADFEAEVRAARPDLTPAKAMSRARSLYDLVRGVSPGDPVMIHGAGPPISAIAEGPAVTPDGLPALRFAAPLALPDGAPEDLRNSMRAHAAVSACRAPRAAERILALRETGRDAGAEALAQAERIGSLIEAHEMAALVAMLLESDGYKCRVSPPGPDGGVDIHAGKGLLGLSDSLLVQVKSGRQVVSAPQVQQILGILLDCGANATLIVSWSGFTTEARAILRRNPFRIVGWTSSEVLDTLRQQTGPVAYNWQKRLRIDD